MKEVSFKHYIRFSCVRSAAQWESHLQQFSFLFALKIYVLKWKSFSWMLHIDLESVFFSSFSLVHCTLYTDGHECIIMITRWERACYIRNNDSKFHVIWQNSVAATVFCVTEQEKNKFSLNATEVMNNQFPRQKRTLCVPNKVNIARFCLNEKF
jgi:hypothetical protein